MEKVLVVDDVYESLLSGLKSHLNATVTYLPEISSAAIQDELDRDSFTGLVVRSKIRVTDDILRCCPSLKWIARAGSGIDNIDQSVMDNPQVQVLNADGANAQSVAEHTLGMMLAFNHRLLESDQHVRNGNWNREAHRGIELKGKTVGIVGVGNTGMALARVLSGFGSKVIGYDKYKIGYSSDIITEERLKTLTSDADILSFHVPLTTETKGMIGKEFLANCSKIPLIINASRGGVMNISDVDNALQNQTIRGLCLDVLPDEPPLRSIISEHQLIYKRWFQLSNVMFSPHVAGWSKESYINISERLLNNILEHKGIEKI